jgi:hypothetical protein
VGYNAGSGSYGEVATEVNGTPTGIYGHGPDGYGVYGDSSTNGNGAGVYGTSDVGFGVEGVGTSTADAGFFYNQSGGYAGYFYGDVDVNGALAVAGKITAGTKDFKIDHPLDPEGKYLYHASVESSEMMNIYSGNVELDSSGAAWVDLPRWFDAVNGDFRYQLTSLGKPQPGLYVASEISQNRFQIAGGIPNGKVSWQVAGVRHDPYAIAHPMQVEEDKPAQKRGTYLHPEAFGQPVTRSEGYLKIRNLRFPSNTQDTSTKGVISEAKR